MTKVDNFIQDESGATIIEYGLLAALLSVAAIAILPTLGTAILNAFTSANNAMATAVGG